MWRQTEQGDQLQPVGGPRWSMGVETVDRELTTLTAVCVCVCVCVCVVGGCVRVVGGWVCLQDLFQMLVISPNLAHVSPTEVLLIRLSFNTQQLLCLSADMHNQNVERQN